MGETDINIFSLYKWSHKPGIMHTCNPSTELHSDPVSKEIKNLKNTNYARIRDKVLELILNETGVCRGF